MQAILGNAVFVVVVIAGIVVGVVQTKTETVLKRCLLAPLYFVGTVLGCYIVFAAVGGFFWVLWWIGIVIREILQWLVVAVLYPWHWLF